jgi:thiol-disulfide isomerase/thioredoxin
MVRVTFSSSPSSVALEVNGRWIAQYASLSGQFEFPVPPGNYSLYAYGMNLQRKRVEITVPPGRDRFEVPPIDLDPLRLVLLQGQPAPELAGDIVGWKGQPVRLADLRGKYVLLDFWGYWCDPCVAEMPVLMELHDKFAGRGLAIVTVHVDLEGDVDSPAKLEEKIASVKASLWGGRDLPFPTALSAGRMTADGYDGLTAAQYGVQRWPTTLLIDRQGKVVGEFIVSDFKSAAAEIEKLLAQNQ